MCLMTRMSFTIGSLVLALGLVALVLVAARQVSHTGYEKDRHGESALAIEARNLQFQHGPHAAGEATLPGGA
jgi:hypothetical protein